MSKLIDKLQLEASQASTQTNDIELTDKKSRKRTHSESSFDNVYYRILERMKMNIVKYENEGKEVNYDVLERYTQEFLLFLEYIQRLNNNSEYCIASVQERVKKELNDGGVITEYIKRQCHKKLRRVPSMEDEMSHSLCKKHSNKANEIFDMAKKYLQAT